MRPTNRHTNFNKTLNIDFFAWWNVLVLWWQWSKCFLNEAWNQFPRFLNIENGEIGLNLARVLHYIAVSLPVHYGDVIMGAIASQIISLTIVYSTVYSDADQRKHPSSASLAFVLGINRGPVNSPHKWPVTRKMFPFDDVIMKMHNRTRASCPWSYKLVVLLQILHTKSGLKAYLIVCCWLSAPS